MVPHTPPQFPFDFLTIAPLLSGQVRYGTHGHSNTSTGGKVVVGPPEEFQAGPHGRGIYIPVRQLSVVPPEGPGDFYIVLPLPKLVEQNVC